MVGLKLKRPLALHARGQVEHPLFSAKSATWYPPDGVGVRAFGPKQEHVILNHVSKIEWRSELADDRLVLLSQYGDFEAQEILIRKYTGLVKFRARNYFIPGAEREDLIQEGLLGLLKAIRDFRSNNGTTFRAFADLCVGRQIITAVKSATRQKHAVLNYASSLYSELYDEEGPTLIDRLPAKETVDGGIADELEPHLRILADAKQLLSSYEFEVLKLFIEGFTYQEIAAHLGKGLKSVDNAVFKVKLKLRRRWNLIEQPTVLSTYGSSRALVANA